MSINVDKRVQSYYKIICLHKKNIVEWVKEVKIIVQIHGISFGGSVWESNPPFQLLTGNTGFEGRAGHQNPMHSR